MKKVNISVLYDMCLLIEYILTYPEINLRLEEVEISVFD
jgi:hypothetical protein